MGIPDDLMHLTRDLIQQIISLDTDAFQMEKNILFIAWKCDVTGIQEVLVTQWQFTPFFSNRFFAFKTMFRRMRGCSVREGKGAMSP